MLIQWGRAEFGRDDYAAVDRLLSEGLSLLPDIMVSIAVWLNTIPALVKLKTQGLDAAAPHLRNALDMAAAQDFVLEREEVLTAMGEWAIAADKPTDAIAFLGAATAARQRIAGLVPEHRVRRHHERTAEHLRRIFDDDEFERLFAEGGNLSYDEAAQRARALLDGAVTTYSR
jgi:hypothetical protein